MKMYKGSGKGSSIAWYIVDLLTGIEEKLGEVGHELDFVKKEIRKSDLDFDYNIIKKVINYLVGPGNIVDKIRKYRRDIEEEATLLEEEEEEKS